MTAFLELTAPEVVELMEHTSATTFNVLTQDVLRQHESRIAEMEQRLNEIKQQLGGDHA